MIRCSTLSAPKTKRAEITATKECKNDSVFLCSSLEMRGKALFLIVVLGIGGTFQNGYHNTGLSSPSPVRNLASSPAVSCLQRSIWRPSENSKFALSPQFIQSFINSSWTDRYEETPPPHMVTMIWSLIVSLYGLGAFFGSLSISFVSCMLGRCVKKTSPKTNEDTQNFGCCGPNRLLLLCSQENDCSLQQLHRCCCGGDHAGKQSGRIL